MKPWRCNHNVGVDCFLLCCTFRSIWFVGFKFFSVLLRSKNEAIESIHWYTNIFWISGWWRILSAWSFRISVTAIERVDWCPPWVIFAFACFFFVVVCGLLLFLARWVFKLIFIHLFILQLGHHHHLRFSRIFLCNLLWQQLDILVQSMPPADLN